MDEKTIQQAVNVFIDILQTIKMLYLDIPEDVCDQFFQMIPFALKVPQLWRIAMENYKSYYGATMNYNNGGSNTFNILDGIMNGSMMGMGMGVNPAMQNMGMGYQNAYTGMNQPQFQQAPQQTPPGVNPFAPDQSQNVPTGAPAQGGTVTDNKKYAL